MSQQTNSSAKPADETKPTVDKTADAQAPELNNWVEVGVGGSFVSGDKGQFQRQAGVPASAYGGIQSFHYEQPVDKTGLFSIDGRGIFDDHDYSIKLELSHPDKGYVRAGYREFRQYYDGNGGFLPSNGLFFGLADNRYAIDRADAFFEAGLTLPDLPVITFRYDHQTREGQKDSTEWGTTTLAPGGAQKKTAPAYRDIDETLDVFALDAKHTIKKTELGLGVRYEIQHNSDSQNILMQPNQGPSSRLMTQQSGIDVDMFNVHAFTDTRLNDKVKFTTGYSFTTLHSDLSGSRLDSPVPTGANPDTRFIDLSGGSDMQQHVLNLNLMYDLTKNLYIVPAVRVEKEDLNGSSSDNPLNNAGAVQPLTYGANDEAALYVAESLDARYVGITNWVFYARGEWSEDRANLKMFSGAALPTPTILDDVWHRMFQKYSLGANWYPMRHLNFAAQYYYKISDNDYDNTIPVPPTNYPGFIQHQKFTVNDVNFRMTWRPCTTLSLVSRYDFQLSSIDSRGGLLAEVQSGNNTTHMFGDTISWTPLNRFYIQAGANYVLNSTHTPAENWPATAGVVQQSKNDYWTANAMIGYAIDEKTDLQAQYSYYRANDYVDNSSVGLPYGAGGEEHNASATLGRQITRNVRWTLRYAFSSYRDHLSGGNNTYEAHVIYSSLQYRF